MDFRIRPTEPGKIRITASITDTVEGWRKLADSIRSGVEAGTPEAATAWQTKRTPEGLYAADNFARKILALVEDAEKQMVQEKDVSFGAATPLLEGDA